MAQANPIPATAEIARLTALEELREPIQQKMLGEYATGSIDIESTVYRILADVLERYAALEQTYEAAAGERAILRREAQERIQNQDLTQGPTYVVCGPDGQPLVEHAETPQPATLPVSVAPLAVPLAGPPTAGETQDEEESPGEEAPPSIDGSAGTADTSDDQQQGKQALVPHHGQHLSIGDEHEINEEAENAGFIEPDNDADFGYPEDES